MEYYEENPDRIQEADIVVGIPSFNEAASIAFPTKQADLGLREFFPDKRSVIVNCDNSSTDGTREAFLSAETDVPKIYISTPKEVTGKGNNLRNLFRKTCDLGARACTVLDADLKSIRPKWIYNLAEPLSRGFGFVAPLYVRHKYDGTITNNIAYPLIRSVYGRRVRQPIGGEFGFSGDLARIFLETEVWDEKVAHFGIDIWMTTIAICNNIPICQAFMGGPKSHAPKDPAKDLGPMFREVIGTIFLMMSHFEKIWKRVRWSKPTAIFGYGVEVVENPAPVELDKKALYEKFYSGIRSYTDLCERIIGSENWSKLREVIEMNSQIFDFPADLWAKILFDFAVAYNRRKEEGEEMLDALIPLYYGKTYSYILKAEEMSMKQAEEYIEEQSMIFEEARPYLDEKWE